MFHGRTRDHLSLLSLSIAFGATPGCAILPGHPGESLRTQGAERTPPSPCVSAPPEPLLELRKRLGVDLARGTPPQLSGDSAGDLSAMMAYLASVYTGSFSEGSLEESVGERHAEIWELWKSSSERGHSLSKQLLLVSYSALTPNCTTKGRAERLIRSPFLTCATDDEAAQFFSLLAIAETYLSGEDAVVLAESTKGDTPVLLCRDASEVTLLSNLYAMVSTPSIFAPLEEYRALVMLDLLVLAAGQQHYDQGNKRTCGSTCALAVLDDVPELSRLTLGLISEGGEVELRGGATLRRTSDWTARARDAGSSTSEVFGRRGPAQALLQSALMDLGNGEWWRYSDRRDVNFLGPIGYPGFFPAAARASLEQLTGRPHQVIRDFEAWRKKATFPAMVLYHCGGLEYHWIVVKHIEGRQIYYTDPNGAPRGEVGTTVHDPLDGVICAPELAQEWGDVSASEDSLARHFVAGVLPIVETR